MAFWKSCSGTALNTPFHPENELMAFSYYSYIIIDVFYNFIKVKILVVLNNFITEPLTIPSEGNKTNNK